jgi:DNA-binding transcriptional LysR family regulator
MTASLDDLVSMAMFARVVEAKSFTAAAAALSVSKSAISKRVAALEERLGARLLHRTTRRLSLTSEGARLYDRCMLILRAADEAPGLVQAEGGEPRGVLRLSCPTIFADLYLADAIVQFVERYPAVHVEVFASNDIVDLVGERVDLAIRMSPRLESSSLVARRLATVEKVVCAAPDYVRRRGIPRVPDDLRAHDCLRFSPLLPEVEWKFAVGRSTVVVPVSGPLAADSPEMLRRAALAGAGIISLPYFCIQSDLADGKLVRLLEAHPVAGLGIYAVYAKGQFVPAKLRKFVDFLAAKLRPAPWERLAARSA